MRHSWNRKGAWQGSKDVRTCLQCGLRALKAGMHGPWRICEVGSHNWLETHAMPPCKSKERVRG